MNLLTATIVFILGTAVGSFLSVVIYRLKTNTKGVISGHSYCPYCKKKLKWRHLIPVLSWLFLQGKCGYCGKKISVHYLMLEILTGLLFLFTFSTWNFIQITPSIINPDFLNYSINWEIFEKFTFYIVEFSFLIAIFFYDLMHKEIPDQLSLPAIVIAAAGGLTLGIPTALNMLIGGAAIFTFFLLQFLISRGKWIGGGDIRLGAFMGIFLGWEKGLLALVLAYLIGGAFSLFLLASKKINRKSTIPFGPFMITGILIVVFFGERILDWYFNSMLI